jgi:hypothetical protein
MRKLSEQEQKMGELDSKRDLQAEIREATARKPSQAPHLHAVAPACIEGDTASLL